VRAPRRPDAGTAQFQWEPDADQIPTAPLPEPAPPEERCGFLIEQYTHPLDRVSLIYQISKSGATLQLTEQQFAELAAMDDAEFTATMAARLAEVLAQRHGEARAAAQPAEVTAQPPTEDDADDDWLYADTASEDVADEMRAREVLPDDEDDGLDDDERREREWARSVAGGGA